MNSKPIVPVAMTGIVSFLAMVDASAAQRHQLPTPFEEASIIVEQNATDGDTEVVIEGRPGDDGLKLLYIQSPDRRNVATLIAPDPSTFGQRVFRFESPEPPGEAVLAAYPEGRYTFIGVSTTGERFRSTADLSHDLPGETTILYPPDEATIPATELTIQWSAVTGIREYVLEFENESADPEQTLTLNLPPETTSFVVPPSLLVPGADYQIGIHTVGENGNIVAIESTFSTAE